MHCWMMNRESISSYNLIMNAKGPTHYKKATYPHPGTGDLRTPYPQCAAESYMSCSPSARRPARRQAGAVRPEDRPPCRRCGRSSSHLCFSAQGRRRGTAAPGSRRGSSECRPSSGESWERRGNTDTCLWASETQAGSHITSLQDNTHSDIFLYIENV